MPGALDVARYRAMTPEAHAEVDWTHPISFGLAFATGPCVGWRDLVRGIMPTGTAPAAAWSRFGVSASVTTAAAMSYSSTATSHLNYTAPGFSVMAVGSAATMVNYPLFITRYSYTSESVNSGWLFPVRADSDTKPGLVLQCHANNAVAAYAASASGAGSVPVNVPAVMVGVNETSGIGNWLDGRRIGFNASSISPGTNSSALVIGGNDTHVGTWYAVWSRALTAQEIGRLALDPFCFVTR